MFKCISGDNEKSLCIGKILEYKISLTRSNSSQFINSLTMSKYCMCVKNIVYSSIAPP